MVTLGIMGSIFGFVGKFFLQILIGVIIGGFLYWLADKRKG